MVTIETKSTPTPTSTTRTPMSISTSQIRKHRPTPSPSPTRLLRLRGMTLDPTPKHIWIITGPAGCGKTTVAKYIATQLSLPYVEGDDWHSASNKAKMSAGTPLTDNDRWDWLITLRKQAVAALHNNNYHATTITTNTTTTKPTTNSVVVTCSALKHKYRDVIRVAAYEDPNVQIHFVYLKVDEATLQNRVAARVGHYMKEGMVSSQMSALEEPDQDDERDVLAVDTRLGREATQRMALEAVKEMLSEYDEVGFDGEGDGDDN